MYTVNPKSKSSSSWPFLIIRAMPSTTSVYRKMNVSAFQYHWWARTVAWRAIGFSSDHFCYRFLRQSWPALISTVVGNMKVPLKNCYGPQVPCLFNACLFCVSTQFTSWLFSCLFISQIIGILRRYLSSGNAFTGFFTAHVHLRAAP